MSVFRPLSAFELVPIWDGVVARAIVGREMTFAVVELGPNATVAEHRHPNEQIGIVLKGSMRFRIGGETREIRVGDTYAIPGDVPHDAVAGPEGAVVIDAFAPVRKDWARLGSEPPRAPVWP
jgi:quercetin dioxygenase-like cupin family protein